MKREARREFRTFARQLLKSVEKRERGPIREIIRRLLAARSVL